MTVIAATTFTIKPGAYEAFRDSHTKSKALLERCGARNIRLMGSIEGGGALVATFEFEDYSSYGKFMDAFTSDPEGRQALMSTGAEDSPVQSYQASVWTIIDE